MNDKAHGKRLEKIEVQLTPAQWAIRLATEMRRYASRQDFLKAIAKGGYRDNPYLKPFFMLVKQAEEEYPGKEKVEEAKWLSEYLHGEYHALETLIVDANETLGHRMPTLTSTVSLRLFQLEAIIRREAFAQITRKAATWIGRCPTTSAEEEKERQAVLTELLTQNDFEVVDPMTESLPNSPPPLISWRLRDWADSCAMLLTEAVAYKTSIQIIQERYLDSRPILFNNIEAELESTIRTMRDAIGLFNEYSGGLADPMDEPDQEAEIHPSIDIGDVELRAEQLADTIVDDWVTTAKNKGKCDILEARGKKHEDFVWQNFRKVMGVKS
jgi:hypothetical protein